MPRNPQAQAKQNLAAEQARQTESRLLTLEVNEREHISQLQAMSQNLKILTEQVAALQARIERLENP